MQTCLGIIDKNSSSLMCIIFYGVIYDYVKCVMVGCPLSGIAVLYWLISAIGAIFKCAELKIRSVFNTDLIFSSS